MQGGLSAKTLYIYSVSYFNFGGLGAFFGGLSPPKLPRGDGTGSDYPSKVFMSFSLEVCVGVRLFLAIKSLYSCSKVYVRVS